MLRTGAWRRAISSLTRAQEQGFASAAAGTKPAQGLDASLPAVSDNHKGPSGVLQVVPCHIESGIATLLSPTRRVLIRYYPMLL